MSSGSGPWSPFLEMSRIDRSELMFP
uniref:Uncharacterized protein n=1 Tax=Rhizophora mucronata TaxID=61149 RepID=A0A2P2IVC4_RHIMU